MGYARPRQEGETVVRRSKQRIEASSGRRKQKQVTNQGRRFDGFRTDALRVFAPEQIRKSPISPLDSLGEPGYSFPRSSRRSDGQSTRSAPGYPGHAHFEGDLPRPSPR